MREGTRSLPVRAFIQSDMPEVQPREGMRLGRYELLVPIAQGGMAEVWIARLLGDLGFSRVVALKTIRPEYAQDPSFRKSFFEEARIAARLSHANVVEVLDLGEEGPLLFQVMRLIEGDSMSKLLRHRHERLGSPVEPQGLPVHIAVRMMIDALAGLHAAHELTDDDNVLMQLVHRDVSPHNILVGIDGVARLADFGVAKALGRLVDETEAGQIRGKPGYFAPEQIDRKPLDRRTDVFAAGICLWEAMTGKHLFRAEEGRTPLAQIEADSYPDPGKVGRDELPKPIVEVTMRALSKRPEDRFPTAADMSLALDSAARLSGGPATTAEVTHFVTDLCGHRVLMQRSLVRRAVQAHGPVTPDPSAAAAARDNLGGLAAQLQQLAHAGPLTPPPITVVAPPPASPIGRREKTTAVTDFIPVPIIRPRPRATLELSTVLKLGVGIVGAILLMMFLKRFVFSRDRREAALATETRGADTTLARLPQDRTSMGGLSRSSTAGVSGEGTRSSPPDHKRTGRSRSRGRGRTR